MSAFKEQASSALARARTLVVTEAQTPQEMVAPLTEILTQHSYLKSFHTGVEVVPVSSRELKDTEFPFLRIFYDRTKDSTGFIFVHTGEQSFVMPSSAGFLILRALRTNREYDRQARSVLVLPQPKISMTSEEMMRVMVLPANGRKTR